MPICVDLSLLGKERLIFDAGTGLRLLGESLLNQKLTNTHLLLSHYHWDHIQGFPFFAPAFIPGNILKIYGATKHHRQTLPEILGQQMSIPYFPITLKSMKAALDFQEITIAETFHIGEIAIDNRLLNHPGGGCLGYSVNWRGLKITYMTDTEHLPHKLSANVLFLAEKADVLIIDSMYTNQEYHSTEQSKVGWGHSTWEQAVEVAKLSQVKQLILFHHAPDRTDRQLDEISVRVKKCFPATIIAQEGLSLVYNPTASKNLQAVLHK